MAEEWKTIPTHPRYEVSSHGRVRGVRKAILKGSIIHGYVRVQLWHEGKVRSFAVHVLVAEAFLGKRPSPCHEVAHRDGKGINNRKSNLRWSTKWENEHDKLRHGTRWYGGGRKKKLNRSPHTIIV